MTVGSVDAATAAGLPWGKLDRKAADRTRAARLSLLGHCIDVAAVMAALLALPTLRARLDTLAGRRLNDRDRLRLTALALLHDIGKAGAGFQSRGLDETVRHAWRRGTGASGEQMGHVQVVAPLFGHDPRFATCRDALGLDAVLRWGSEVQIQSLWLAAISHHGEPVTAGLLLSGELRRGHTWLHPVAGYEPAAGLAMLGNAVRCLLPNAFDAEPMAPVAPGLVHAFAGLVSLSDWIGSKVDDDFFPYTLGPQDEGRWPVARERATQVLRRMHLDPEAARADLHRRSPSFEAVFGVVPRPAQQLAAQWQGDEAQGRVVVLEAETGSGKTEAALWRFKTLFEAGEVDALCFLLPTRVAATGIYGRLQGFIEALFPDPALRPPTVLAVPGYLRANGDEGQPLPGFEVLWPDLEHARDRAVYWAAENSKRYFAASALAGTIDQFLLSALQTKHAHLRGSLALRALVVVDEVHASDAYMTALLHTALDRHVGAGGHALLMSATLTGELRGRLLRAGTRRSGRPRPQATALSAPEAPYPAVTTRAGISACAGVGRSKTVRIELQPSMRDAVSVAALAAAELQRGARVLVLRNTVRQAVATQQALEALLGSGHRALFVCGGVAALHHGRYAFEDRQRLDAQVEALFGKAAMKDPDARALVGTQTLEISVDCDSDVMITDIAPIDVLLQRVGRLHRHAGRDDARPPSAREPRLIVLTPAERDLTPLLASRGQGLGIGPRSAYENLLAIEAAWRLLQAHPAVWQIPLDNRRLVEAGASTAALQALAAEQGGPWQTHFDTVIAQRSAKAGAALPVQVRWDEAWDAHGGWSDLGEDVRTRLGLDGVDLELPQPWLTPLGSRIDRITAPAWMLRAPVDEVLVEDLGDELRLSVAGTVLRYGRLGLSAE